MADHVEGPDLPAALGRVGEAVANVEDLHAVTGPEYFMLELQDKRMDDLWMTAPARRWAVR
jgi:hypothetical protein